MSKYKRHFAGNDSLMRKCHCIAAEDHGWFLTAEERQYYKQTRGKL